VLAAFTFLFCAALAWNTYAQSAIYNPMGSQYQANPFSYGQSSNQSSSTGQAGPSYGGTYQPGGGGFQSGVSTGGFSPTVIPNVPAGVGVSGADAPDRRVTNPTEPGALLAPLYARPGASPGEFELFARPPPQPNEFEAFVAKSLGRSLPRFGASLILSGGPGFAIPSTTTVPQDYKLNPGDELIIGVTGSVEANLRLTIDSEGRIFVPRIGTVDVAGIRYGDLADALKRRFGEDYKQVTISVVIGRLHGLTVYVTGYAVSPGSYSVSSLSTLVDAVLAAGGPSRAGSYRDIVLKRDGRVVSKLDLYDLLLKGDKSHDAIIQNGDVINIGPSGPEIAVSGSVNAEAIYEAKPGDTLADVIGYAGGVDNLADKSHLLIFRLSDLDAAGSEKLTFEQARGFPAEGGDVIRILSQGDVQHPVERQAILATIDGEVNHPGHYYLPPGSTLGDLLEKAGGLTPGAFVFGTQFARERIRREQKVNFDKALDDLRLSASLSPLSALAASGDAEAAQSFRTQATLSAINTLSTRQPDGRIVLTIPYENPSLPTSLRLEDDDQISIPPIPTTVGVFGAVYRSGSFVFAPGVRIKDYVKLSGGPQRYADRGATFVVHANGAVESQRIVHDLNNMPVYPGDVIFVPVRTTVDPFERIKEIATVVYQLGIGVATIGILAAQL
jgi:protein involved in polysaccharide export with SLBB domain